MAHLVHIDDKTSSKKITSFIYVNVTYVYETEFLNIIYLPKEDIVHAIN